MTAPFYELLKDNVAFYWDEELEQEFCDLKKRLADSIPLTFFYVRPDVQTYLTTDASGDGISAVLIKKCQLTGIDKPVYFLSRKLSAVEQPYSATEKEFVAVLWGIERLLIE